MVDRVQHTFFNSIREYVPAPLSNKISLKAVAILSALGLVLICAYYLHKSRVTIKKPDEPKPEKPLTVKEIRVEKFLELIKNQLSDTQYLGKAIDNGDCFYDALSQALKQIGINALPKQLRLDIAQALNNSSNEDHIKGNLPPDYPYENYKKYVQYTHEELLELRKSDPKIPDPYWGAVDREGIVLCHIYKCNIRILSAGFRETEITNDKSYKILSNQKAEKYKENEDKSFINNLIDERITQLYQTDSFYFIGNETYPKDVTYSKICTLALYENHFVPVLTKS